jgi:Protein kinase domain
VTKSSDIANSHPTGDDLARFIAGRLTDSELDAVSRHLRGCAQCTRDVERLPLMPIEKKLASLIVTTTKQYPRSKHVREEVLQRVVRRVRAEVREFSRIDLHRSGGMGIVLKAERRTSDGTEIRAIKVFDEEYVALVTNSVLVAPMRERFRREYETLHPITHTNIVRAFEYRCIGSEGVELFQMEWVNGPSLQEHLANRPATEDEARHWLVMLMLALKHVHRYGIIHRDIKPSNCLLAFNVDPIGRLKLADFGLGRLLEDVRDKNLTQLTLPGSFLGTSKFASPRQKLDPSSANVQDDVFSAGMTIAWALSTPEARQHDGVPSYALRRIHPQFRAIIYGMIAAPEDRFGSAQQVLSALSTISSDRRPVGRRTVLALGLVAFTGLAALAGTVFWPKRAATQSLPIDSPIHHIEAAKRTEIKAVGDVPAAGGVIQGRLRTTSPESELAIRILPTESGGSAVFRLRPGVGRWHEFVLEDPDRGNAQIVARRLSDTHWSNWQSIKVVLKESELSLYLEGRLMFFVDNLRRRLLPGRVLAEFANGEFDLKELTVTSE